LTVPPDGLVCDADPSLCEEFLDIPEAQGEPEVQLDAVADDLGGESVAAIPYFRWFSSGESAETRLLQRARHEWEEFEV